jgi:glycerol uptake facilitator-like aquaporin
MMKRAIAEFFGTGLLVAVVVGSGTMAVNISQDIGVQLLINTVATIFALGLLIELLGPISGAHFNPLVTIMSVVRREKPVSELLLYVVAQCAGGISGAMLANLMFSNPAIYMSQNTRSGLNLWLGEVVATAGLIFVIFQAINSGKSKIIPILVPAWIGSAYFFTSSTSFANPAVTIARAFSDTFSGIKLSSVSGFVGAQIIGALIGYALVLYFTTEKSENHE